jgi:hypothetical protein
LGVRRIREFNVALLGKWCWRLLVDREGLWFRVLSAQYGVEGGQVLDDERDVSTWRRVIVPFSGQMSGSVSCHLETGLADYLIYRCLRGRPCLRCVSLGGGLSVTHGDGGGGCLRGRSWWGSLYYYFKM